MTERLADVSARIGGIRQLGAVVNAMRGIAAARAQQARAQLDAVDRYAETIGDAIAQALALPAPARSALAVRAARSGLVLFCAEQGFAGAFSQRVLDAAAPGLSDCKLFVAGTRGAAALAERQVTVPGKGPFRPTPRAFPSSPAILRMPCMPALPKAKSIGWRLFSANGSRPGLFASSDNPCSRSTEQPFQRRPTQQPPCSI